MYDCISMVILILVINILCLIYSKFVKIYHDQFMMKPNHVYLFFINLREKY